MADDVIEGKRVVLTIPPCPPGLPFNETEQALLAVCRPLWHEKKIPVIGWGCEFDGTELLPPVMQ